MATAQFDVVVIGAGSVGNPTAYFLEREGLRTLVLDEFASSGQGQNKAAIGGVRATHSDPAKIGLCQQSLEVFSQWKEATGTDIGWKKGGYCFPAFDEKVETTIKGLLPVQKRHRLHIDWLEADGIRKVVTGINEVGLRGGTYSPDDGQVSPLLAAESFTREAVRLGAVYRYREPVTSLVRNGNAVVGVRTEKEEYRASTVVNASGVRATEVCKMAGLDIPVLPDSHEGGISAPVAPFLDPLVVDLRPGPEGKTINFYFGQDANGQIIFCYTPKVPISGTNRNSTYEFMPTIAARLVEVIPAIEEPHDPSRVERALPDDPGRQPRRGEDSERRRVRPRRRDVRSGVHARPRRRPQPRVPRRPGHPAHRPRGLRPPEPRAGLLPGEEGSAEVTTRP